MHYLFKQIRITQADHIRPDPHGRPMLLVQCLMRIDLSTAPVVVESPQIRELGNEGSRQRLQRRSDIGVHETSNDKSQAEKNGREYKSIDSHAGTDLCGFQCVNLRKEEDGGDRRDKKTALPGSRNERRSCRQVAVGEKKQQSITFPGGQGFQNG